MNELNKLYKAMLMSWGGVIKGDGKIAFSVGGEEFPIRIDGMDMYLPLSEVLDTNCNEKVFFHPACENITSKETEVFKIIRKMTCMKLIEVFRNIPMVLFTVATAKEKKNWRQDVLDLLEPLKGVKRATRDELNNFLTMMHVELEENGLDNRFIHFKVTKGGGRNKSTGERVYYKTKPSFPFYNEVIKRLVRTEGQSDNQQVEFNNKTVSRGVLKLVAHLFQTIIPAVQNPDDYEFDATQSVAARLTSYLGCYNEIAEQMNRIQNTFRADFDKVAVYPIDLDWMEYMEELPEIYRQVPVMDYNSHNTTEEAEVQAVARTGMGGLLSVTTQPVQQQQQQMVGQQQQPQGGVQHTYTGDYDMTPPVMQPGDRFLRSEIDQVQGRVLHHAINTVTGQAVVYQCTRHGNVLQRVENIPNMGMGMGGMMPGLGLPGLGMPGVGAGLPMGSVQLPNGLIQLPNGQLINPMGMGLAGMSGVTAGNASGGGSHTVSYDAGGATF